MMSTIFHLLTGVFLLLAAMYDLKYRLIPLWLIITPLVLLFSSTAIFSFPLPITTSLVGGLVVGGLIGLIYLVTRGKKIGEADIYFGIMMGGLFGAFRGLLVFSLANFLGLLLIAPFYFKYGKKRVREVPLVTFMVFAIFLEWTFGYMQIILRMLQY